MNLRGRVMEGRPVFDGGKVCDLIKTVRVTALVPSYSIFLGCRLPERWRPERCRRCELDMIKSIV